MFVSRTRGRNVILDVFLGSDARGRRPRCCRNIHFRALKSLKVVATRTLRLQFLWATETI